MKSYSVVNKEKFESLKEDIKGSFVTNIDALFSKAHLISINTNGDATHITAEYVDDNGEKKTNMLWFDSLIFRE